VQKRESADFQLKALVFKNGLRYQTDYPIPVPKDDEALIRVTHAGICNTDLEIIKGYMGFQGIPGHEFVGIVEKCGEANLTGKRVVGEINVGCGECDFCKNRMRNHCAGRSVLGILNRDGAFAEYITLPVENLHEVPDSVTNEEAVFTEPLAAAFEILQQISVKPSDKVCVLGDGKLGLLVGQVLATTKCDLVVMGKHKEKLNILKEMGINTEIVSADTVGVRYAVPIPKDAQGGKFDIVVDCTGSPSGIEKALWIVKPRGTIVLKTTVADNIPLDINQFVIREITLVGSRCGPFPPAIRAIEKKQIDLLPLVSGRLSLNRGVEAFQLASKKGVLKVILEIH
jgi:threonine dehydrogenase-like Zn-dependent dehydrogenase